ncbi:MAG TPA: RNA polymerase sigma factor [Ktedonobacterales bacterium]|jgi:RNA polymerase sigma-70 factor (ECF subfamily)|nr:RNA polymerase sigma factor [Ktedonobacterales bacterium]
MSMGDAQGEREEIDAIRRCQQGDIASLGTLVARYQIPAVRLAYLLTGDHALADDIAQDSFLLAYRGIKRFRLDKPFAPWFYRIVTNTARQQMRYAHHRHEISLDALSPDDSVNAAARPIRASTDATYRSRADRMADPAEYAEVAETHAALLAVLAALPQKQREAVVLRYYLGYSDQQIALILGRRLGTVQQRLHAGRANLQQAIRRHYPWLLSALSTLSTNEL